MMMTTIAVGMTVAYFFFCGTSFFGDFDVEMQRLSRERVIAVNKDVLAQHI